MMQRINGAVYNWSFSRPVHQRINGTGYSWFEPVHQCRGGAPVPARWVVGQGSSIRLFAFCIAVAMFFIVYFAKTGGVLSWMRDVWIIA